MFLNYLGPIDAIMARAYLTCHNHREVIEHDRTYLRFRWLRSDLFNFHGPLFYTQGFSRFHWPPFHCPSFYVAPLNIFKPPTTR